MIKDNQILLTFKDRETVKFIRLVVRRKCTDLEGYILDNFEWDDQPDCINIPGIKVSRKTCKGCDYLGGCPDGIGDGVEK